MVVAEEILQPDDCFLIHLEIDDCPMAELPVFDLFDGPTRTLLDNYPSVLRDTIVEMLEDTPWLDADARATLLDAGYGTYHTRVGGVVISTNGRIIEPDTKISLVSCSWIAVFAFNHRYCTSAGSRCE